MSLPNPAQFARILYTHITSIKDHLEGAAGSTAPYHLRQSTGNFQITLPDAAGATQFRLNDSAAADVFHVDSDGGVAIAGTMTHSGALVVPLSASPAQTADGSVVWDSDDDLITVGDGSSRKTFYPGDPRTLFAVPTLVTGTGASIAAVQSWVVANIGDAAADGTAYMTFLVPPSFTTLVSASIICLTDGGSANLRYSVAADFAAATEDLDTHSDSIAATTLALTDDIIAAIDVSAALTGLAAGDYVGMAFTRVGSDALDTLVGQTFYVLGLRLTWTT